MTEHSGEITNLAAAIGYCRDMGAYLDNVAEQLEESQHQAQAAGQDLGDAREVIAQAQVTLAAAGFGTTVTGPIGSTQDSTASASVSSGHVASELANARDKLATAAAAFTRAADQLAAQQGLAEQVQQHAVSGAGVARDTAFYTAEATTAATAAAPELGDATAAAAPVATDAPAAIAEYLRTLPSEQDGAQYLDTLHLGKPALLAVASELQLTRVERLSRAALVARILKQAIGARRKYDGLRSW